MANYNYFDLDDVWAAVATLEFADYSQVTTSHGDVVTLEKFGDEYVRVTREGFSGCCSDMADLILCCFVRDNVKMRSFQNGKPRWYRYWDLIRVNNPRHSSYLYLYDKNTGEEICGKHGFWWDAYNLPDGFVVGVN